MVESSVCAHIRWFPFRIHFGFPKHEYSKWSTFVLIRNILLWFMPIDDVFYCPYMKWSSRGWYCFFSFHNFLRFHFFIEKKPCNDKQNIRFRLSKSIRVALWLFVVLAIMVFTIRSFSERFMYVLVHSMMFRLSHRQELRANKFGKLYADEIEKQKARLRLIVSTSVICWWQTSWRGVYINSIFIYRYGLGNLLIGLFYDLFIIKLPQKIACTNI